jgi:hypothetical protein
VTLADRGIAEVRDLKGRRLSVGMAGSETELKKLREAHGVSRAAHINASGKAGCTDAASISPRIPRSVDPCRVHVLDLPVLQARCTRSHMPRPVKRARDHTLSRFDLSARKRK